jgi:hypothetical protein
MEKRELRCGRSAWRTLGGNVDRDEGWDDRCDREFDDLRKADDRDGRRKLTDTGRADDACGAAGDAGGSRIERVVVEQRLGREEQRDQYDPR